nr:carboxypeptidase regulatory-like domain-containing protein [Halarchaeum solikamskense]
MSTSLGGDISYTEYDTERDQIIAYHKDSNGNATVSALSPSDGSVKWQTSVPATSTGSDGTLGPNHAYLSASTDSGTEYYKYDLSTGERVNTFSGPGMDIEYVPGDGVLGAVSGGTVYAVNTTDGSTLWSQNSSVGTHTLKAHADGRVAVSGSSGVMMLDNFASGYNEQWTKTSGTGASYEPGHLSWTANGTLVTESTTGTSSDVVYVLDASDGSEVAIHDSTSAQWSMSEMITTDGAGSMYGAIGSPPADVATMSLSDGSVTTEYTVSDQMVSSMTSVFGAHDYQLEPTTYTVDGTVTDSSGNAIEGASVTITNSSGSEVGTTTTASDGTYSISGIQSGTDYTVEASASGYTSSTQTVDVSSATTVDLSLSTASYSYSATVEDASGTAIGGATVELLDNSGNVVSSGTTASDGTISLSAPSGTYEVEVSADGYDSASGSADLSTSGDSGTFSLSESTYVLDGTVTDSAGTAIENASVTLLDSSGNTVKEVSTASDGTYSFSGVKSGDYTVEVAASDYAAGSKTVTVSGASTVDFSLAQTVWTATHDRPSDGTPGMVFAEFEASGDAVITVEAHNASSGEWETVVDAKQYTVNGTADDVDGVEVDLDGYASEDYDQYRVTVEDVEPANTGVAVDTAGGGGVPGSDGGVPFAVVVVGAGLLLAGGAAIAFEE